MCKKTCIRPIILFIFFGSLSFSLGCGVAVKIGTSASAGTLAIASVSPDLITAGSDATKIAINGEGFLPTSNIQVSGVSVATTFISDTQLQATLPLQVLVSAGQLSITVQDQENRPASASALVSVVNPAPIITGLSPSRTIVSSDAILTITGKGFLRASSVLVNGSVHSRTFVDSTQLLVPLQAAELNTIGNLAVSVENCAPGGGDSGALSFAVMPEPLTLTRVSPDLLQVGGSATVITLTGTGFAQNATIYASSGTITVNSVTAHSITATVPASLLQTQGSVNLAVANPGNPVANSNAIQLVVGQLPRILFVSPASAPIGDSAQTIVVNGSGFSNGAIVQWNGTDLETTLLSENTLSAVVPAAKLAGLGNYTITVAIPSHSVAGSSIATFTTYLQILNNDIVYSPKDGYLYASLPASAENGSRSSIVAIKTDTGEIVHSILIDGEPNKLALSADGGQLYVGLDSAHGYRQIDLATGVPGSVYPLLTSPSDLVNSEATVTSMAVMPGEPNTVAIYSSGHGTVIYDAGVPRPNTSSNLFSGDILSGQMAFSPDGGTLFSAGRWGVFSLAVDSSGFTGYRCLDPLAIEPESLQYDGGRLYRSDGVTYDVSPEGLAGVFQSSSGQSISGPFVSDAGQTRAFAFTNKLVPTEIQKFDENTFVAIRSLDISGVDTLTFPYVPQHLLRWGENGLAFRTSTQIFSLSGSFVGRY